MIEELFFRFLEGDEEAFEKLYRLTCKRIFAYIYRLCRNPRMAEEIMVQTYLEVWKSASNFRGEARVITWIYAIARHLTYRALREKRPEESLEEKEMHVFVSEKDPFRDCLESELRSLIKRALNEIPLKHREVLDLIFLHGLTYEEVAKILDVSINTVKTRVFYAKKKLREILEEMGVRKSDVL